MPRSLFSVTVSYTTKPCTRIHNKQFSASARHNTLVPVDTIRHGFSNFVIRSRTTDPFLNLAIEDHLLRTSDHSTHILFTYVNRPCVVIGRNQNPWLETNLAALKPGVPAPTEEDPKASQEVLLVRRRSGGGTVFHDEGNLNYSFLVPNDKAFNRNKHAEMVVEAIRGISPKSTFRGEQLLPHALTEGIRVNERHDIMMPARDESGLAPAKDAEEVKVSGSAYKLTRGRALHHGTLLLSSPNIKSIGSYLRSSARGFIDAKGVESVRSPIGNLRFSDSSSICDLLREEIEKAGAQVFRARYPDGGLHISTVSESDAEDNDPINAGVAELRSLSWKYLQTPTFTFTTQVLPDSSFRPAPVPDDLPQSTKVIIQAKHGVITSCHISLSVNEDVADAEAQQIRLMLQDRKLHEIGNWGQVFEGKEISLHQSARKLAEWLVDMFPSVPG
jgi:lipoate---protein ligase